MTGCRALGVLSLLLALTMSSCGLSLCNETRLIGSVTQIDRQAEGGGGSLIVEVTSEDDERESGSLVSNRITVLVNRQGVDGTRIYAADGAVDFGELNVRDRIAIVADANCGNTNTVTTFRAREIEVIS